MVNWGAQQGGEVTIYQDSLVLITNQRMQTGGAMYPLRNITAVSGGAYQEAPDYTKAWACFGGAALGGMFGAAVHPGFLLIAPLGVLAGLVSALAASGRVVYTVIVATSGMQHPAVQTYDQRHRDTIAAALQRAVAGG